jgi:hypothetical protein
VLGDPEGGAELELEPVPMLGQFLVEPDDADPDEMLGVELEVPLEPLPVLPVAVLELGVEVDEFVAVDVLIDAAFATRAPPVTRPVVSAAPASTLRNRGFFMISSPCSFAALPR